MVKRPIGLSLKQLVSLHHDERTGARSLVIFRINNLELTQKNVMDFLFYYYQ